MDLLALGTSWLAGQLSAHASRPVSYARGAHSVALDATLGRTLFKLDDGEGGILMEWSDRDFLIPGAMLVLAGQPSTPARGDTITLDGRTYEVLAPGGEPPWRWSDPHRVLLRVHTKLIEE
jgi:hypothetical protein